MTNSNREREIFEAALDLPTDEERLAFVQLACGDDQAFAERMQRLLALGDEECSRPDHLKSASPGPSLAEGPGTVIGRYKLVEQIGEGGFGVVYLAEQSNPVKRRVALKIIKPGMDSKQVIARFEAERQALALMDHPHIAHVHDAGATESGRPFIVMEFVKGIPITQFCREQKLDLDQRLNLFIEVCRAVQHAHQKGVIHRDLKPSNILVTLHCDQPVPKVINFGIAKATLQPLTEQTLFTHLQHFLGTPAYMSPEQATLRGLDIDTRSDIYSLGVLLYELLTGGPPFETNKLLEAGFDEMSRILREEEPQKPSAKISHSHAKGGDSPAAPSAPKLNVASDLDWVVMKALEKDRVRRYETADGLSADLRRFLKNEPVTAVAPTLGYQLGKLFRRHRSFSLSILAVLLILVGATVFSSWQAARASKAEALANERTRESEAISEFLVGIFQTPEAASAGGKVSVEDTLSYITELARTLENSGRPGEAMELKMKARVLSEKLRGPDHPLTFFLGIDRVRQLRNSGRHHDAVRLLGKILEVRRHVFEGKYPDSPSLGEDYGLEELTRTTTELAVYHLQQDLANDAEDELRTTRELVRQRRPTLPEHERNDALFRMHRDLAYAAAGHSNLSFAERCFQEAEKYSPQEWAKSDEAFRHGVVLSLAGDRPAFENFARRYLASANESGSASAMARAARLCLMTDNQIEASLLDEAEKLAREALRFAPKDPWILLANSMASRRAGDLVQAETFSNGAITKSDEIPPCNSQATAFYSIVCFEMDNLGNALRHLEVASRRATFIEETNEARKFETTWPYLDTLLIWEQARKAAKGFDPRNEQELQLQLALGRMEDSRLGMRTAIFLQWFGDLERHHKLCLAMLKKAAENPQPTSVERSVKALFVNPRPDAVLERQAVTLARQILAPRQEEDVYSTWYRLCMALVEYREGRFKEAINWVHHEDALPEDLRSKETAGYGELIEAMASHQLGDVGRAAALLASARKVILPLEAPRDFATLVREEENQVFLNLLLAEAQSLMTSEE